MSQDAAPDFTTEPDPKDAATGKYFQVHVPNFTKVATPSGTKRDAYLRIGSMAKFADGDRGKELFEQFTGFAADSGVEWHERDASGEGVARPVRYGFDGETAVFATKTQEEKRAALLAGAAWRDHCDGNRVTTTSGDKVEIVGGNYHLLVLGRAASADGASFDDHSGGNHIDGTVSPPQTVTSIRYTSTYDGGDWAFVEESRKTSVHEIFTGEFREDFCGPRRTSVVGMLTEPVRAELFVDGVLGGGLRGGNPLSAIEAIAASDGGPTVSADANPDIVDITLAQKITEYTGAAASPVTSITSKTFAGTLSESTTVTGQSDEKLTVGGILTTTRTVGLTLTENTTVTGAYTENRVGGSITDTITAAGTYMESKSFSTSQTFATGNFAFEMTHLATKMTLETIVAELCVKAIGYDLQLQVGKHSELFVGFHSEVTLGRRNEIVAGSEVEFTAADTWQAGTRMSTIAATVTNSALAYFLG
jgi:hypothetical protein